VIEAMPRPRPPHLQREVTRHGKANWYVRIGKGPRVRIRADFGTPEFDAEYQAAITGHSCILCLHTRFQELDSIHFCSFPEFHFEPAIWSSICT